MENPKRSATTTFPWIRPAFWYFTVSLPWRRRWGCQDKQKISWIFRYSILKRPPPSLWEACDRGRPDESLVFNICQTSSNQRQNVVGCGRTESHFLLVVPPSWHRLLPKPPIQGCALFVSVGGTAPLLTPAVPARRDRLRDSFHQDTTLPWLGGTADSR